MYDVSEATLAMTFWAGTASGVVRIDLLLNCAIFQVLQLYVL